MQIVHVFIVQYLGVYKDVSIFKIPSATNDSKAKWRKELINIITKDRVNNSSLRKQIASNHIYICERRFTADQIWIYGSRKTMKDDAIPSLNLPVKSIVLPSVLQRPPTVIKKREENKIICQTLEQHEPPATCYISFSEFKSRTSKFKLAHPWVISYSDSLITIICPSTDTLLPKYENFVEPSLRFSIRVFVWMLDKDHELYTRYDRSFLYILITLSKFLKDIENYTVCQGIKIPDPKAALNLKRHVIFKVFSFSEYTENSNSRVTEFEYFRSIKCTLSIVGDKYVC